MYNAVGPPQKYQPATPPYTAWRIYTLVALLGRPSLEQHVYSALGGEIEPSGPNFHNAQTNALDDRRAARLARAPHGWEVERSRSAVGRNHQRRSFDKPLGSVAIRSEGHHVSALLSRNYAERLPRSTLGGVRRLQVVGAWARLPIADASA